MSVMLNLITENDDHFDQLKTKYIRIANGKEMRD